MKKALVIGGTSGLGLALARALVGEGYRVVVTGRRAMVDEDITRIRFDVGDDASRIFGSLDRIVPLGGEYIDLFVYSAGAFERGTIGELGGADIVKMLNVGLVAPALFLQRIMLLQKELSGVILVTSTSQWTPRLREPVYTAAKAGLAMLGHSVALDPNIGKVLIAAPAGMDTSFWRGEKREGVLLDPEWVAREILRYSAEDYTCRTIRILRDPPRTEIVETR